MKRITNIRIDRFRGISNLIIENVGDVNLIVGDNNCGKTSILEAIQLLRAPKDINNVLRVARIRDYYMGFSRLSIYDNFINMFPVYGKTIEVACSYDEIDGLIATQENVALNLSGAIKKVMIDYNEIKNNFIYSGINNKYVLSPEDSEIDEFYGQLIVEFDQIPKKQNVRVNKFTSVSGRSINANTLFKISYLSPIDHMMGNSFSRIISNEKYKEICIKVLQLFDEDILDLILLKSEYPGRIVEYVKHKKSGLMPLSTYGDGIKKVLAIANAIAQSTNGILLIDEIDTAIHAKYYDNIFKFIIKAAKQYKVQLFISTHSIEAVDGLLKTQVENGIYNDSNDPIRVITLRKDKEEHRTLSRTMMGKEVFINREQFNFEVRL